MNGSTATARFWRGGAGSGPEWGIWVGSATRLRPPREFEFFDLRNSAALGMRVLNSGRAKGFSSRMVQLVGPSLNDREGRAYNAPLGAVDLNRGRVKARGQHVKKLSFSVVD